MRGYYNRTLGEPARSTLCRKRWVGMVPASLEDLDTPDSMIVVAIGPYRSPSLMLVGGFVPPAYTRHIPPYGFPSASATD